MDEGGLELDTVLEAQSLFFKEMMTLAFQQFLPQFQQIVTREQ